jgi:hypothetical protein
MGDIVHARFAGCDVAAVRARRDMSDIRRLDIIGNELNVGDLVVSPYANMLSIGRILRFTKKMIQIKGINHSYIKRLVKDMDVLKIEGEAVTMYILKKEK